MNSHTTEKDAVGFNHKHRNIHCFGVATSENVQLLLITFLTIIFMAFSVNLSVPFEQDQGSKAAKITYMVKSNTIFEPLSGPRFYRDNLFSLYYIISAIIYKVTGGDVFVVMNLLSVFLGIIFFSSLSVLLHKVIHTSHFTNWVVFISMPILTTTFLYGNEVAFSITFFVLSLVFLSFSQTKWKRMFSALFLCASAFCRPDITLLIPFWIGWYLWIKGYAFSDKRMWCDILELFGSFLATALIYWFFFVRKFELGPLSFDYHTNIKLLLAYMTYPFNLTIVLIGTLSIGLLIVKREKIVLLLFFLTLPVFFYFNNLSSPKYIIGLAFFFGIPTVMFLGRIKFKERFLALALICIWYLTSITPYGMVNFRDGAGLFIPTADGPIPSGSYFWFYRFVREGFYSSKYKGEIESARRMIQYMDENPDENIMIVGRFNDHFLLSELAASPFYTEIPEWMKRWYVDSFPELPRVRYIMPQRAYLSFNNMSAKMQSKFLSFLIEGRVRGIAKTPEEEIVFPFVIEIGDAIPPNTDPNLAGRILFVYKYYKGEGIMNTNIGPEFYSPTYWLKASRSLSIDADTIHEDNEWKCYSSIIPNSQIWVTEMPDVYSTEQDPNE